MKWGIRRYQNEDGSYKPGAEGRYDPKYNSRNRNKSQSKTSSKENDGSIKGLIKRSGDRGIKSTVVPAASVLAGFLGSTAMAVGVSAACSALFPLAIPAAAAYASAGLIAMPSIIGGANAVYRKSKYAIEDKVDTVKTIAAKVNKNRK